MRSDAKYFEIFILFVILSSIFYSFSMASSIIKQKSEEIIKNSDLIIEAYVKKIDYHIISNSSIGYVDVFLGIDDVIKGKNLSEVKFRRVGLNDKKEFLFVDQEPDFKIDDKFIICLVQDKNGKYWLNGFYNGIFFLEGDKIKGTTNTKQDLKEIIIDILSGKVSFVPKKFYVSSSNNFSKNYNNILLNSNPTNIQGYGSHMNGQFDTFNQSWNSSYLPTITFYYNHSNAPDEVSESDVVSRINEAFNVWNSIPY